MSPHLRLVSLACSNTEIVCALGLAERLVAVDDHSDFPAAVVAGLPRVGPDGPVIDSPLGESSPPQRAAPRAQGPR